MKTEKEKMLAGEYYDPGDTELITRWHLAKKLTQQYNQTASNDKGTLDKLLGQIL